MDEQGALGRGGKAAVRFLRAPPKCVGMRRRAIRPLAAISCLPAAGGWMEFETRGGEGQVRSLGRRRGVRCFRGEGGEGGGELFAGSCRGRPAVGGFKQHPQLAPPVQPVHPERVVDDAAGTLRERWVLRGPSASSRRRLRSVW